MRMFLLAAALSVSGAAVAQTADDATTTDTQATSDAGTTATTDADTAAPSGITTTSGAPGDGVTQQGTDPNGMGNAPPGTNEVTAPVPGATVLPSPDQAAAFTPRAATTEYPACSKTVTDGCVQTYERGARRPR